MIAIEPGTRTDQMGRTPECLIEQSVSLRRGGGADLLGDELQNSVRLLEYYVMYCYHSQIRRPTGAGARSPAKSPRAHALALHFT